MKFASIKKERKEEKTGEWTLPEATETLKKDLSKSKKDPKKGIPKVRISSSRRECSGLKGCPKAPDFAAYHKEPRGGIRGLKYLHI